MAKFRTNHAKQGSNKGSGMTSKVSLFTLLLAGLYFLFSQFSDNPQEISEVIEEVIEEHMPEESREPEIGKLPSGTFLPTSTTGQVVKHRYYTLSYSEEGEQAEWVAYQLTRAGLKQKNVKRTNDFREDDLIKTGSATIYDYRRSGYDRGHLVPAADMAFNREAMSETFYMSNISPQLRHFNGGIWRELEELTRDWAYKFKKLYIVTGPILTKRAIERIGKNKVEVPAAYYKILLDLEEPELKAIAFIMPNEVSDKPVYDYVVTIDEVEELTGINFFPNLMSPALEEQLESTSNKHLWEFSLQKYELRVQQWNLR